MSMFKGLSGAGYASNWWMAPRVLEMVYAGVQELFKRSRHTSPVWNKINSLQADAAGNMQYLEMNIWMAYRRVEMDVWWSKRIGIWKLN